MLSIAVVICSASTVRTVATVTTTSGLFLTSGATCMKERSPSSFVPKATVARRPAVHPTTCAPPIDATDCAAHARTATRNPCSQRRA